MISGVNFSKCQQVNTLLEDQRNDCFLVYPSPSSFNIDKGGKAIFNPEKRPVFIVLDGTWPQAKKMLKLSTNLQSLRTVSFDHNDPSAFKFKQQPFPECLSTIESTKLLIDKLNQVGLEKANTSGFLRPFEKLISKQIDCQNNPPPGSYRSAPRRPFAGEKTNYKSGGIRKVCFDPDRKS